MLLFSDCVLLERDVDNWSDYTPKMLKKPMSKSLQQQKEGNNHTQI